MLLIVFPGLNNYLNACSIQFGSLQTTLLAIGLSVSVVVSHLYVQIVSIVGCVTGYQVIRVIRIFAKTYPFE